MIRFYTIFPEATLVHLNKDVGQVPIWLKHKFKFDSFLVTSNSELTDQKKTFSTCPHNIGIKIIPRIPEVLFFRINVLLYIVRNARRMDVLNLYHFTLHTLVEGALYKLLNRKGILYIKLDADPVRITTNNGLIPKNVSRFTVMRLLIEFFFRVADIFSTEMLCLYQLLQRKHPTLTNKLLYIPNGIGISPKWEGATLSRKITREKQIISVGRIGTYQKNTELLLSALKKLKLGKWKVKIVGPIEDSFKNTISDFYREFPTMRKSVYFTGEITNRLDLIRLYKQSEIFCLTSRYESYGLVLLEALFFGCYAISTNIPSSAEIINCFPGQAYILMRSNADCLAGILRKRIGRTTNWQGNARSAVYNSFLWSNILCVLEAKIVSLIKKIHEEQT